MTSLNEYMHEAATTAVYPNQTNIEAVGYLTLGLTGEAGEVANQVKKIVRDDGGNVSFERQLKLLDEIGDVLWYAAMLAQELGADLETVALTNLAKLQGRAADGTLRGDRREEHICNSIMARGEMDEPLGWYICGICGARR